MIFGIGFFIVKCYFIAPDFTMELYFIIYQIPINKSLPQSHIQYILNGTSVSKQPSSQNMGVRLVDKTIEWKLAGVSLTFSLVGKTF